MTLKINCSVCKVDKDKSEFYRRRKTKSSLQTLCKTCKKLQNCSYKRSNSKYLKYNLKHKYNLTVDEYNSLVDKHGSKCAICRKDDGRLCIDHCHSTGKVRGILCNRCNTSLHLIENHNLHSRALKYLEEGYIDLPDIQPLDLD